MPAVLIVTVDFPPSSGGGRVMRIAKLAKYLPALGWQVTVLCADIQHPEIYDAALAQEIPPSVQVVRLRSPLSRILDRAAGAAVDSYRSLGKHRLVGPLIRAARAFLVPDRWILWSLRASRAPFRAPPDIVLSSGPPHSAHIAGARLARRFDVPHVMDLRDTWADGGFGLRVAPWQKWIDTWLERRVVSAVKGVVVAVPEYADTFRNRYPGFSGTLRAITNGYDVEDVADTIPRRVVPIGDGIEFLYAGRLVGSQRVGRLVEVLGSMSAEDQYQIRLRFMGQVDPEHAREAIRHLRSAVRFDRPMPHRDAIRAMAEADVLVVVTTGGGWGNATQTGKIFECLALRRPVLLIGPSGPTADLLASTQGGAWAETDDAAGIRRAAEAVIAMSRDPSFLGATTEQLAPFTRANLAHEWHDLLQTVTAEWQ